MARHESEMHRQRRELLAALKAIIPDALDGAERQRERGFHIEASETLRNVHIAQELIEQIEGPQPCL